MDKEVELWMEELLDNGTFESREDIYEFCVFAVKKFCEANKLRFEREKKEEYIERNLIPIRLTEANEDVGTWKEFLDKYKDITNIKGSIVNIFVED